MTTPAALDAPTLTRRLHDLAGDERCVQVDFLLHLDEFDRRQAFLPLGYGSLWDYCLRALHLREGASGRRIGAMRVLRRFPALEAALRDGRLCLSTASLLGQVLTEENLPDLVARAAFRTKAEVEELVVTLRSRAAPRDGIRKLPAATAPSGEGAASGPGPGLPMLATSREQAIPAEIAAAIVPAAPSRGGAGEAIAIAAAPTERNAALGIDEGDEPLPAHRASLDPVARDRWSLRVTLDGALKEELEALKMLLGHKVRGGDLTEVLREAVRCGIEKHGKRRGAVAPTRPRQPNAREARDLGSTEGEQHAAAPTEEPAPRRPDVRPVDPRAVPAWVRREVWARDRGRCTFVSADGRRCDSRALLEFDHVEAAALGGPPAVANLRLRCRGHNLLHAVEVFGREHMDRFRTRAGAGAARASPCG